MNRLKKFIAIMIVLVFTSSCATIPPFIESSQYKQVLELTQSFDWNSLLEDERKIPEVTKMDGWQFLVHDAKKLEPIKLVAEGKTYIAYTEKNHRELLKQLLHGRLGWSIAMDMQKAWEKEREEKHYIIKMAKLEGIQMQQVLKLWAGAEDRNKALERRIMIDGVLHKLTVFGMLAGGILLFTLIAL